MRNQKSRENKFASYRKAMKDKSGISKYYYDSLGRLLSLANKNASGQIISSYAYNYDAIGRRTKVTMPDAQVNLGYDNLNQLTSEARTGANAYNIAYAYDKSGNRISLTKNTNRILYNHNSLNQLLEEKTRSSRDSITISVSGTIDDSKARVFVQEKPATVSGTRFQANGIIANRGVNLITAMAEDLAGNKSYHQIKVNVLDPDLRKYAYDNNGNLIKYQTVSR